jgi:hypothetical protein
VQLELLTAATAFRVIEACLGQIEPMPRPDSVFTHAANAIA